MSDSGGVNVSLCLVAPCSTEDATEAQSTVLDGLNRQSLAHDRASASEDLQVGNGSTSGRGMARSGR